MSTFSNGSLVWVDLGFSYGRWPGEVVDLNEVEAGKKDKEKAEEDVGKSFIPKRDVDFKLTKGKCFPLKDVSFKDNATKNSSAGDNPDNTNLLKIIPTKLIPMPGPSKLLGSGKGTKTFIPFNPSISKFFLMPFFPQIHPEFSSAFSTTTSLTFAARAFPASSPTPAPTSSTTSVRASRSSPSSARTNSWTTSRRRTR
jgi:hypothetical protein